MQVEYEKTTKSTQPLVERESNHSGAGLLSSGLGEGFGLGQPRPKNLKNLKNLQNIIVVYPYP